MDARWLIIGLAATILLGTVSVVRAGDATAGRALAQKHCGACHALDRADRSPKPEAPPFRTLHQRYPVDGLEEALAEGMVTLHPDMPEVTFAPDDIDNFIAYLKTLEQ